jgi:hypothetical protein
MAACMVGFVSGATASEAVGGPVSVANASSVGIALVVAVVFIVFFFVVCLFLYLFVIVIEINLGFGEETWRVSNSWSHVLGIPFWSFGF